MLSLSSPLALANLEVLDDYSGPHVEKIRFERHLDADWRAGAQALLDEDVDIYDFPLAHLSFPMLYNQPNIGHTDVGNLGTWWLVLNCERWPLNVSGVRRALLFALNKTDATLFWGEQFSLLDSLMGKQHPMSIENEMEHHYYDPDLESAATLLDSLGFVDSDDDGWREGPGGVELPDIWVMHGYVGQFVAPTIAQAFLDMNISAYADFPPDDGPGIWSRIDSGDFFMVPVETSVGDVGSEFDFWAEQFKSEHVGDMDYYAGWTRWSNSTWDELAEIVLHSTDYDEIVEAAKEMQYIMLEDCPRISIFQQTYRTAYRTDTWEGFVDDVLVGASSFWTAMKAHLIDGGPMGGTLRWAVHDLNLHVDRHGTDYPLNYGRGSHFTVTRLLYDPLVRIGPDYEEVLWLADSYTVRTSADNPVSGQSPIPDGHTRITVDLIQDATWSDRTPLTSIDCVYSIQWFNDNFEDARENQLAGISAVYAPTPYTLIVEFDSESWWHWHSICYLPILPSHLPDQNDRFISGSLGITAEEFERLVVSGPFLPLEYVPGDYCEIVDNPAYRMNPRNIITTTTTTPPPTTPPPDFTLAIVAGSIGSAVVIVAGVFCMRRE
jgi:ABC-type transport system substrate-binding protein